MHSQILKDQYPSIYNVIAERWGNNEDNFKNITEIKEIAYQETNEATLYKICDSNADFLGDRFSLRPYAF